MATTISAAAAQESSPREVAPTTVSDMLDALTYHSELTGADAVEIADLLGIDFAQAPFSVEDLLLGLEVERDIVELEVERDVECECAPSLVDAPEEDLVGLATVAVTHLQEQPDYYARLTQAQAPGDPPAPMHAHHAIGCD